MQYLEIRGAVDLKDGFNKRLVVSIMKSLLNTEFDDSGFVDVSLDNKLLSIQAEGEIDQSQSVSIKALLSQLQNQLSKSSIISVLNVRWETIVTLKQLKPTMKVKLQSLLQLAYDQ